MQSGLELLSIPAETGNGKMNGFSLRRLFLPPAFESDVAGVKIQYRIHTIKVKISIVPQSHRTPKSLRLTKFKMTERASLVTQLVKNLPAMQEAQVRSLGQKDPLEKGMATQSSILA